MKRQLIDILVCPVCKGKLELAVTRETGPDIVEGSLYCPHCRQKYPIAGSIPNLLPPQKS